MILMVDDDVLVRASIAEHLRECGYRVVEAHDADEAIDLLQATPIDLVFTDILMPGSMDGLRLAAFVRERYPEVPVILASGVLRQAEVETERYASGPLIEKPYSYDEVAGRPEPRPPLPPLRAP